MATTTSGRTVEPWLPWWATYLVTLVAGVYLVAVFVEGVWPNRAYRALSRPVVYFAQIAKLFADRSEFEIEFRVEGFDCEHHQFRELDVRPYFPMHANDKENRFDRTMSLFLENPRVYRELESYILDRHNARVAAGEATDLPRIGGVELISVRIPIPEPGDDFPRYRRVPLSDLPLTLERKVWYITHLDDRMRRCEEPAR
jgi:hypothetical protein